MTSDPNWLLSSVAQSSAAMVAIIGGLLVSRLITLAADTSANRARLEDLEARRKAVAAAYDAIHRDRLRYSETVFVDHHLDDVIAVRGAVALEELLEWQPIGSSDEEMKPIAARLIATVQEAYAELGKLSPIPARIEDMRAAGLAVAEQDSSIWKKVADRLRPKSPWTSAAFPMASMIGMSNEIQTPRQDARIRREEELRTELRTIDSEIDVLRVRLSAAAKPKGVVGAFIALGYLAGSGIVFPTVLMAWRPVPDDLFWRELVVAAFVSGLICLLFYFTRERKLLSIRSQ